MTKARATPGGPDTTLIPSDGVAGPGLRRPARIGIISQGTSQFDSRAQRIARSCVAAGDMVTIYSRYRRGLPMLERLDGYRIVRLPLNDLDEQMIATDAADADVAGSEADDAETARSADTGTTRRQRRHRRGREGKDDDQIHSHANHKGTADGGKLSRDLRSRSIRAARATKRRTIRRVRHAFEDGAETLDRRLGELSMVRRWRQFPWHPMRQAAWFERQVEPHDIWHGMWAGSLPALSRLRRRYGGATLYDARDVFLRARMRATMPGWERWILTRLERHWAHQADAVIQVSEQYAAMMQRDLGLGDVPVVRNCPDRWVPPEPRPDRFRELLGIPPETAIVLYQGLLMSDRGIEQAMDAILQVPDAVLVLMGFRDQNGRGNSREDYPARAQQAPWKGRVHVVDPVAPTELLTWSASSDVMVMLYQSNTENHQQVTPQKLWEAMAAGVPVVASDLPAMAPIVSGVGFGVLCDPSSPASIAAAIRQLLDEGQAGLRARGQLGWQAAQETYNWENQFEVLDSVYARLLARR